MLKVEWTWKLKLESAKDCRKEAAEGGEVAVVVHAPVKLGESAVVEQLLEPNMKLMFGVLR